MRGVTSAAFWMGLYLVLVLAPLLGLLLGEKPPGGGYWWDFAIALGFAGLSMMGMQFILTARFRRATAPYGIDIIYYLHRYLAVICVLLILAHAAIAVTVNPAFLDSFNPFAASGHMSAGVASTAALLLVVVSSLWRKALGIRYEAWRVAHAGLAVLAATLALVHVRGVDYYTAVPWKRALWSVIVASWVVVVVYVRAWRPWRLLRRPYRVAAVTPERGDAWTMTVEPVGHGGFRFQPGQFAWLTVRSSPFAMQEHPFSFSSSPSPDGRLEFTIKELGDFTRTVGGIEAGEPAYVDGPYGAFSTDRYPAAGCVFIGGGIGLAPLMSMLRGLADRGDPRPHLLITANSRLKRTPFREAMETLAGRLQLKVVHVLEEPPEDWPAERGRVTAALLDRHLPPNRAQLGYFVCGPPGMIDAVERALSDLGVPMGCVHSELFDLV